MFINGRFLGQRVTGVQRFARETISAGAAAGVFDASTCFLTPDDATLPEAFAGFPVRRVGKQGGHKWEQFELSRAAGQVPLLNLCNTAPLFRRRQLVVLHDAAVAAMPAGYTRVFRLWYQTMIRTYGHFAAQIATVSKFSALEISKYFGIPHERIAVIGESGEHILREMPDYSLHERFGLERDGYFLAVSSLAPNKNFAGVIDAVARLPKLPFKFVIVGGRNTKIFNSDAVGTQGATEVGYVTDGQLRALYERATCFVYPSLYEGFGLPPLEAMSSGCPVLVSRSSSMPEICGDAAAYCDPRNPSDIARQLSRLFQNPTLREDLRQAGKARAAVWTWDKAARELHDITKRAF